MPRQNNDCRNEEWGEVDSIPLPGNEVDSNPFQSILQAVIGEMGVDLSSGDISVTKCSLNKQQVGGTGVKVRRKCVAQSMRRDVLGYVCLIQPVGKSLGDLPGTESGTTR